MRGGFGRLFALWHVSGGSVPIETWTCLQHNHAGLGQYSLSIGLCVRKGLFFLGLCCALFLSFRGASADMGSAVGLSAALANCENNSLSPEARIKFCTMLIRSNLADPKMEGFLYALLGQAHSQAGEADEALEDYTKALEHFPDYVPALINHAALEMHARAYDVALADYDKAVLTEPTNTVALRGRCGARLELKKDLNGALADCNKAILLEPGNANAFMMRRDIYMNLGLCAEAAADFDSAVKIDPSLAKAGSASPTCRSDHKASASSG